MNLAVPKSHGPGMVLGELFFRKFLTVFSRGSGEVWDAKVGIARAKHDKNTAKKLAGWTASTDPRKGGKLKLPEGVGLVQTRSGAWVDAREERQGMSWRQEENV